MPATTHKPANPLAALPSVLAIRDLRRRVRRSLDTLPEGIPSLVQLLRLDPPTLLRALRSVSAPIYRNPCERWTVAAIAAALGPSCLRRALDVPPVDVIGTAVIRRLWVHSVATAHGASMLARDSGLLDPEEAYLLGLVQNLDDWLACAWRRFSGSQPSGTASEWARRWDLPACLVDTLAATAARRQERRPVLQPADTPSLLCAAQLLAELADFPDPIRTDDGAREVLVATAGKGEFVAAQHLRREVQQHLAELGLDPFVAEPDLDAERLDLDEDLSLFHRRQRGDIAEVVQSVLGCSKAGSYRGIVTALTAAPLRYMGYDRAWFVKWARASGTMVVRTKADLSARRVHATPIAPTAGEQEAFARCLREERPCRLLDTDGGERGLLQLLGVDEALVVPVNREFQMPAFLLLDRSLTTRPIQVLQDAEVAGTLGITASLLTENLLLKRRRQRALKFAVTDPLTRLFNRRMGITTLDQEIARSQRSGSLLTVLMIDLDNFKNLNDVHGHLQGDQALRATAEVLRKTLRKSDTICRYGGEEFMVVLPETTPEDAAILSARLSVAVEARGKEIELPTTVSIGQASIRQIDTVEAILQRADQALYASKQKGRNRFSIDVDSE